MVLVVLVVVVCYVTFVLVLVFYANCVYPATLLHCLHLVFFHSNAGKGKIIINFFSLNCTNN